MLIKVSQKRGKIIYLYKSENIDFFITFKVSSKFQESSFGKVKEATDYNRNFFCVRHKNKRKYKKHFELLFFIKNLQFGTTN